MDYTLLSLSDVRSQLEEITREAQLAFGGLGGQQLNWRPDATRWSVAQCLEHLVIGNGLMFRGMDDALTEALPRSIWQRMPLLPRMFGKVMVRSQSPTAVGHYTAPSKAQPGTSTIGADIVQRFIDQHREAMTSVQALDERRAARTIMESPFVRVITYSVLDGWRIVVAHDWRHLQQARRVTLLPEFPSSA